MNIAIKIDLREDFIYTNLFFFKSYLSCRNEKTTVFYYTNKNYFTI